MMRLLLIFGLIIFAVYKSGAQTLEVKKVKKNQAIVIVQEGRLRPGQIIQGKVQSNRRGPTSVSGGRDQYIGLSGEFGQQKVLGVSVTNLSLSGEYGWNKITHEYGVLGSFGTSSGAGVSTTLIGAGGRYDHNLVDNNSDNEDGVYGLGVLGSYTMASGSSESSGTLAIFPSFFYKLFLLDNSAAALRLDVGLRLTSTNTDGKNSTDTGLRASAGLVVYF